MRQKKQPFRRRAPRAERQAQILAAAFKEFAAKGYAGARLDNVAKRAQVAKGTIFLHFRDKKSLFRAVLRSLIHAVRADVETGGGECRGEAQMRELLSRIYAEVVENEKARALLRLLIAEGEHFPELAQIYYQEIIAPGASAIELVVEDGIDAGVFESTVARGFPQILVAPAILAVVWVLLFGRRHLLDIDAYREAHLDFVARGLRNTAHEDASRTTTHLVPGGKQ